MIHNLKTLIKFFVFHIINLSIFPSKEIESKSLLLIRLDAIGDYVLFRNFIEVLKNNKQYKDYNITLLGNIAWKSIAIEFDSNFIDKSIWLDKNRFNKDLVYRYKKLNEITRRGYEIVLSPVYSREFFCVDTLVKQIYAKEKIGSLGELSNIKKWQKSISDNYYTKLVPAKNELMFEFSRNKEFFKNLLQVNIDIRKPTINLKPKSLDFDLPKNYVILFIGAGASFRRWDVEKFAIISNYLREKYNYQTVLCGGPDDIELAKEFAKHASGDYLDLVGKTSLLDFLTVIYNGNLMVANETSAPHFAVALEMTKIFVISNGNHYGRFTPYPKEVFQNYHVIYHPEIENDLEDHQKLSITYGQGSELNINDITIESAINKIDQVIQQGKSDESTCIPSNLAHS